jgi:hypothetical protein
MTMKLELEPIRGTGGTKGGTTAGGVIFIFSMSDVFNI